MPKNSMTISGDKSERGGKHMKKYGIKYEVAFNSSWYRHSEYSYRVKANSERKAIAFAKEKLVKEIGKDARHFRVKSVSVIE